MSYLVDVDHLRAHTVSRKSERLVNLTIALLATKRWITKSEIFATVDGYVGEPESKERMFERDKDDLRGLGIDIEVGSFDPLFEDEAGYRIRPEKYRVQFADINSTQISLLSLAVKAWQGAALNETALSAIVKLNALGIDSDIESLPLAIPSTSSDNPYIPQVIDAISLRRQISFSYVGTDSSIRARTVNPYGLISKGGYWYLVGVDIEKSALRTFRLDRIVDEMKSFGRENSFEIPKDFSVYKVLSGEDLLQSANLLIRKDKVNQMRLRSTSCKDQGDWDKISIHFVHEDTFVREILWHLDDVEVLSPQSLRAGVIRGLQEVVTSHGK